MSSYDGTSRACPICKKLLSQENHPAGFVIDICPSGHGSFFDKEEFEVLGNQTSTPINYEPDPIEEFERKQAIRQGKVPESESDSINYLTRLKVAFRHSDKPCPHCTGSNMVEIKFGVQQLIVDECPKCGGIWLDGGEELLLDELVRGIRSRLGENPNSKFTGWALLHRMMHCENLTNLQDQYWGDYTERASQDPLEIFQSYVQKGLRQDSTVVMLELNGIARKGEQSFIKMMGELCRLFTMQLSSSELDRDLKSINFLKVLPSLQDVRTSLAGFERIMRMIRNYSYFQIRQEWENEENERKFHKYHLKAEIEKFLDSQLTRAYLNSLKRNINSIAQTPKADRRTSLNLDTLRSLVPFNTFSTASNRFLEDWKQIQESGYELLSEHIKDIFHQDTRHFEIEANAPLDDFLIQVETEIDSLRNGKDAYQKFLQWSPYLSDSTELSRLMTEEIDKNPLTQLLVCGVLSPEIQQNKSLHSLCCTFLVRTQGDIDSKDVLPLSSQIKKVLEEFRPSGDLVLSVLAGGEAEFEPVFAQHLKRVSESIYKDSGRRKLWLQKLLEHFGQSKAKTLHGLWAHAPFPDSEEEEREVFRDFLEHLKQSEYATWVPDYHGGIIALITLLSQGGRSAFLRIFQGTAGVDQRVYDSRVAGLVDPHHSFALLTTMGNLLLRNSDQFEPGLDNLKQSLKKNLLAGNIPRELTNLWFETLEYYLDNFGRWLILTFFCPTKGFEEETIRMSLPELYRSLRLKDLERERKSTQGMNQNDNESSFFDFLDLNSWFGGESKSDTKILKPTSARNQDEVILRWERLKRASWNPECLRIRFIQKLAKFLLSASACQPIALRVRHIRNGSRESINFLNSILDFREEVRDDFLNRAYVTRKEVYLRLSVFGEIWDLEQVYHPEDLDNFLVKFLNRPSVMEVQYSKDLFPREEFSGEDTSDFLQEYWEKAENAYSAGRFNECSLHWQRWMSHQRKQLGEQPGPAFLRQYFKAGVRVLESLLKEGHHNRDDEFYISLEQDFQFIVAQHKGEVSVNQKRRPLDELLQALKTYDEELFQLSCQMALLSAQGHLQERHFEKASEILQALEPKIEDKTEQMVQLMFLMGQVHFQAGRIEEGARFYNEFAGLARDVMDLKRAARAQIHIADAYLHKGAVKFGREFLERSMKNLSANKHRDEIISARLRQQEMFLYEARLDEVSHMVQDHLTDLEKGFASDLQCRAHRLMCWTSLFRSDRALLSRHLRKLRQLAHNLDHPYYLIESEIISFMWMMYEEVASKTDLVRPFGNILKYSSQAAKQDSWQQVVYVMKNFLIAKGQEVPPYHNARLESPGFHYIIFKLNLDLEFQKLEHESEAMQIAGADDKECAEIQKRIRKIEVQKEQFVAKTGFSLFSMDLFRYSLSQ